jgi:hypothetical protein
VFSAACNERDSHAFLGICRNYFFAYSSLSAALGALGRDASEHDHAFTLAFAHATIAEPVQPEAIA